jgi:hypothetical protein
VQLASSCSQEVDQVSRRMKRVGDDDAVGESERRSGLSVDLGEQDGLRRWRGAVELGQSRERLMISRGCESERNAPFTRYSPR